MGTCSSKDAGTKEGRQKAKGAPKGNGKPKVHTINSYTKNKAMHLQLIPTLPDDKDSAGCDVVIQAGRYGSKWIRLLEDFQTVPSAADLTRWLDEAQDTSSAVYFALPQKALNDPAIHELMTVINSRHYKFYTCYNIGDYMTNELIWYKWTAPLPDRVPRYASSIEGGGVVVVSPDESEVLLAEDYGRWGRCGGACEPGENVLECALRECEEETQCQIDSSIPPLLGLVYNQPNARDGIINDHFMLFIVRAKSTDLVVDKTELTDARWFPIAELVKIWDEYEKNHNSNEPIPDRLECKPMANSGDAFVIGTMELECCSRYVKKKVFTGKWVNTKHSKQRLQF